MVLPDGVEEKAFPRGGGHFGCVALEHFSRRCRVVLKAHGFNCGKCQCFERTRLQPCRKDRKIGRALAPEGFFFLYTIRKNALNFSELRLLGRHRRGGAGADAEQLDLRLDVPKLCGLGAQQIGAEIFLVVVGEDGDHDGIGA